MKTRSFILISILILAVLMCIHLPLFADKGSTPFEPEVQLFEPNQRALITWNRCEEILLLTTDPHASASTNVLEVITLPSEPIVKVGAVIDVAMWGKRPLEFKTVEFKIVDMKTTAKLTWNMFDAEGNLIDSSIIPEGSELQYVWKKNQHGILERARPVVLYDEVLFDEAQIKKAQLGTDKFGTPEITFTFTVDGAKIFEQITEANLEKRLAIILDGKILSLP